MGIISYYFFRTAKGRNAKQPWAIAHNPGAWLRSLTGRGWNSKREVYTRATTPGEDENLSKMKRCFGGRYESLDKLLDDEREILGVDSRDFQELAFALRQYEGENFMPTKTVKKKKDGTVTIGAVKQEKAKPQKKEAVEPDQTELHRRAVKVAKYQELVKDVIFGGDNINRIMSELATKHGADWADKFDRWSKSEFRDEVRKLWLEECGGEEEFLSEEYRTAGKEYVSEFAAFTAREIELQKIELSPLKSQAKRRARFDKTELEKLSDNIRQYGIINPITVRPVNSHYQIVAGERRFLASKLAEFETIPATVKNLTDEQAAEIQMIENLQRTDLHPMDEAFAYQDMKDVLKIDDTEIALRVGKSVGYVTNRLTLLKLDKKVQQHLEKNELTLSHALEISKYPIEAQEEILEYAFSSYGYENQTVFPVPKFIERIQKNYLLQLRKAPFSTKSEELRPDGLACVKCPERTNANPLLFSENYSDKDSCLNRACWEAKTAAHIQIQRRKIAESEFVEKAKRDCRENIESLKKKSAKIKDQKKIEVNTDAIEQMTVRLSEIEQKGAAALPENPVKAIEKISKKVPLITSDWYLRKDELIPNEFYLHSEQYKKLASRDDCEHAERGVYFKGDHVGQSEWICYDKKCKKHRGRVSSGSSSGSSSKSGEELMIRKEEILDSKTAEATRRRVLRKITNENFDAKNTIFTHKNAGGFLMELITRLWKLQCSYSDHTAKVICEILELDNTQLSTNRWGTDFRHQIIALGEDTRQRLLFLLLTAHECEIQEGYWSYASQANIKDLASDFGVDYQKIDAEERLGVIPMKFKDVHRDYLQELESGNKKAKLPRVYSDKWKPKD